MPIFFSEHARNQIRRRKISQKIVKEAVNNPEKVTASYRGRK